MKPFNFILIATIALLSPMTSTYAARIADALTAATSSSAQPRFIGKVLQGPDVLSGASVGVGQPLKLEVLVTNPWTNNTVSMSLAKVLPGMSLTQLSNSQAQPTWVLSWTPDSSEIGTNNVAFTTLFTQTSGANTGTTQTFQPGLPIKVVAGNGYVSDASAIKSLIISQAKWNQKKKTLNVRGKVNLKPGYPLPPSTAVTLSYSSGSAITDPGATIKVTAQNGTWSTVINTLTTLGQNPCSVVGVPSVQGADLKALASRKKVTGAATGCKP